MHLRLVQFLTVLVSTLALASSLRLMENPFSVSASASNKVSKVSNVEEDVRKTLIKNPFSTPLGANMPKAHGVPNSFNWTSCGRSNQIFDIKTLTVGPSPLSFPGPLTFSFDFFLHNDIAEKDNITVAVTLKYLTGSTWLKIPCLGGRIGSCTYTDMCAQLADVSCPSDITKLGLRCNCPFSKGEYKMQPYTVKVEAPVFIAGEYTAMVDMAYSNGNPVGCYSLAFNIQ